MLSYTLHFCGFHVYDMDASISIVQKRCQRLQYFECPCYNGNGNSIVESSEETYADVSGSFMFQRLTGTLQRVNVAGGLTTKIAGNVNSLPDRQIGYLYYLCCTRAQNVLVDWAMLL